MSEEKVEQQRNCSHDNFILRFEGYNGNLGEIVRCVYCKDCAATLTYYNDQDKVEIEYADGTEEELEDW